MKKSTPLICLFVVVVCVATFFQSTKKHTFKSKIQTSGDSLFVSHKNNITSDFFVIPNNIPSREERLKMSDAEKINLFETLGYIPIPADMSDYYLAEKTTWWGKRLDPKEFWTNRVVWFDSSAEYRAKHYGRGYPPIPYDDCSIFDRSDIDIRGRASSVEYTGIEYVFSERESVFWSNFVRTHPRPPKDIKDWLENRADTWMYFKSDIDNKIKNDQPFMSSQKTLDNNMFIANRDAKSSGFPIEGVNPEAFKWIHVMQKRAEYKKYVDIKFMESERDINSFFKKVYVDSELITEPLTNEQIDTANAWKVAYLNRLRIEKWDESYINAYLEAWNLTEEYVFGNKKEDNKK